MKRLVQHQSLAVPVFVPPPLPGSWFVPLSEPVRVKPGLHASLQQTIAFNPVPVVSFGWFESLSEPVRLKPRLREGAQQALALHPNPVVSFGWMENLSEPVRLKPGLRASLQQAYTSPPQLRPNPATSGILNALETPDVFLAGATVWNAIQAGEIGVIELKPKDEVSISMTTTTTAAIAGAKVAITILR